MNWALNQWPPSRNQLYKGKFELNARLMNQLIRHRAHILQVKFIDIQYVRCMEMRKDNWWRDGSHLSYRGSGTRRFNKRFFQHGKAFRKDMLFARCILSTCKHVCLRCIGGCYVEGELQETILKETVTAIDVPLFLTSLLWRTCVLQLLKRLKLRKLRNI